MKARILFGLVLSLTVALPTGVGVTRGLNATALLTEFSPPPTAPPTITATTPTCTGSSRLMQWPTTNPVWEFCFISPNYSTGANGSGLELYDVSYNGHLVFKRAHAPILNVLYAPGGCGCYRDWSDQERSFQSNNVIVGGTGGYAEPTVPPVTVCDNNGLETSGFSGVAAEKLSDRLILTTQTQAGWYRYMMKWTFHADGRMQPEIGFGAVNTSSCLNYDHTHHNYWRFDFDIDGYRNDRLYELPSGDPTGTLIASEAMRMNNPGQAWVVKDAITERGYRLVPGSEQTLPADSFAVGDLWALRYKPGAEIDDSGQSGPSCAIKFNNFLNGESFVSPLERTRADLVVWYRAGAFHLGGDLDDCHRVGPTLVPIGNWSPGWMKTPVPKGKGR